MANDTKYAYAVARVRVLETRLLEKGQIDRMVEARNAQEALQVLGETVYGNAVAELESVYHYEELLGRELGRAYQTVRSFYPEPALVDIFAAKYDVHNLKVLLKAHFQGIEPDETILSTGAGSIPLDSLKAMFREENFRDLPPALRAAVEEIREAFVQEPDPQLIDIILDRALYEHIFAMAAKLPFLQELFTHKANLVNIKTFLRVKNLGRDWAFLEKVLLPGGDLDRDIFRELLDEPLEVFSDRLAMSPYAQVVEEGIREWQERQSLTRFEKLADDFLLHFVREKKHASFGPEPLVGYLMAKENELKLIRIIMVGKINRLPTEEIRERLRDVYV